MSRAVLDFWHADASGEYDNSGFHLRGISLPTIRAAIGWRRIADVERAITLDPNNVVAYLALADIVGFAGNHEA